MDAQLDRNTDSVIREHLDPYIPADKSVSNIKECEIHKGLNEPE